MTTTTSFISNSHGTVAGIVRPNRMQKREQWLKAGRMYQGTW
jgi:hypothetical protein